MSCKRRFFILFVLQYWNRTEPAPKILEPNRTGTENFGTDPNRNRKIWNRSTPIPGGGDMALLPRSLPMPHSLLPEGAFFSPCGRCSVRQSLEGVPRRRRRLRHPRRRRRRRRRTESALLSLSPTAANKNPPFHGGRRFPRREASSPPPLPCMKRRRRRRESPSSSSSSSDSSASPLSLAPASLLPPFSLSLVLWCLHRADPHLTTSSSSSEANQAETDDMVRVSHC